jgi:hypothetical protein
MAALLVLVVLVLGACNSGTPTPAPRPLGATPSPTSKAIQAGPNCELPRERAAPGWVPEEVPLPHGTYFYKGLPSKEGLDRGLFVMRIDVESFKSFTDSKWTSAGIQLLRPDQEPGELEDLFRTSRGTGLFKANDVVCRTPYTRLLLVYGK